MKRKKLNAEDLATKHIAVTEKIYWTLRRLQIAWKCERLSDVVKKLITGDIEACELL